MNKRVIFTKWFMFTLIIVLAVAVIPTFTMLFALKADLIESSLSKIGNELGYRTELILFCSTLALFFIVSISYIFILTKMVDKTVFTFLITTSIVLVMTAFTPFLPKNYPFLAQCHNGFAVSSVCSALVTLLLYSKTLKNIDKHLYRRSIVGSIIVFLISMFTFMAVGMCSLIEVVFVYAVCIFLFLHMIDLYFSHKIDLDTAINDGLHYFENRRKLRLERKANKKEK